jgi:uncharacterized protein DUF2806
MSDNDTNSFPVSISADLSEGGNEILKQTPKGASKIWRSLFGAKAANREREVLLIEAQTAKDCADVMVGLKEYRDGVLSDVEPLQCLTSYDAILEQEKREEQENMSENVRIALEDLSETPDDEISDEELDKGFFARWRKEAKVIANKELQYLWGKILAEETRGNNSISVRTLDVVSKLSSHEARKILEVAPYCLSNIFFWTADIDEEFHQFSYLDVAMLEEAGILLHSGLNLYFKKSSCTDEFISKGIEGYNFTFFNADEVDIPIYSLTGAGMDIVEMLRKNGVKPLIEEIGSYCLLNMKQKDNSLLRGTLWINERQFFTFENISYQFKWAASIVKS